MVTRHDCEPEDVLRFSLAEQQEYHVPAETSVSDGIAIAFGFEAAAKVVQDRSVTTIGTALRHEDAVRKATLLQASRLGQLTSHIYELCPDEHLEFLAHLDQ